MSQTMHPRETCNKSKFLIFTSLTKRLYNGKAFDFSDLRLFQMWGKFLYKKHINSNADRGPNILGRAKVNEQHFLIPGHHLGWYAVHRLVVQERDKALEFNILCRTQVIQAITVSTSHCPWDSQVPRVCINHRAPAQRKNHFGSDRYEINKLACQNRQIFLKTLSEIT